MTSARDSQPSAARRPRTRRRILVFWAVAIVVTSASSVEYLSRSARLAAAGGTDDPGVIWAELPIRIGLSVLVFTLLAGVLLLQFAPAHWLAMRLAREKLTGAMVPIRNFHWSITKGALAEQSKGLRANATVLRASAERLELWSGFFGQSITKRIPWASVASIDDVELSFETHGVDAQGICVSFLDSSTPLIFTLVTHRFPWIDAGTDDEVAEYLAKLRSSFGAGKSGENDL